MAITSKRRLCKYLALVIAVWFAVSMYLYSWLDYAAFLTSSQSVSSTKLKQLMRNPWSTLSDLPTVKNPLLELYLEQEGVLSFYHLPLRRLDVQYSELTSANRDSRYPLAPDFTFHVRYELDRVVLYEDYGPGCVLRVFLFPALPTMVQTLYKMTSADLADRHILLEIDGRTFNYSLQQFMEGKSWPFLYPINTRHKSVASGMGSYTPFCYERQARISFVNNEVFPQNLFEQTINCTLNDLLCPVHIYSAVSSLKYPAFTDVEPYGGLGEAERADKVAEALKSPDSNGPDRGQRCVLECVEMCPGCQRTVLDKYGSGVISSIKMRVFETATGQLRANWTDILLTATFDNALTAQVDRIPLGSLFGATGSLHDVIGAAAGKKRSHCGYQDRVLNLPINAVLGYSYFPMPFWKGATLTLEGTKFIETPLLVCYQLTVVTNYYQQFETGYFNAAKTYYTGDVSGWRNVLSVAGQWGHIVGVYLDVDNLYAVRDVPINGRWAALQADADIFLDGKSSAAVMGTGLEDYFSYSHGFNMAENTSYSFVGAFHSGPRRKEPLTWHCYRHHVLDPVVFQSSVQFVMEGTSTTDFQREIPAITYEQHVQRKLLGKPALSHMALYYAQTRSGMTLTDTVNIGDTDSELQHGMHITPGSSGSVSGGGDTVLLLNKRYIGAVRDNRTFTKTARRFTKGDTLEFNVRVYVPNRGVRIRREFYSQPRVWNECAQISVHHFPLGRWLIPMGALSEEYSLRQEDFTVGGMYIHSSHVIHVKIEPETPWIDVEYKVYTLH